MPLGAFRINTLGKSQAVGESTDHLEAVTFDGSSDYLRHTSSTGFTDGKQITVSYWVYPYSTTGYQGMVWDFGNARYSQSSHSYISGTGGRLIGLRNSSNTYISRFDATGVFTANQWHHVLVSVDLATDSKLVYVNNSVPSGTWSDYSNADIDFTRTGYSIAEGSDVSYGPDRLNADLANFWMDDSYIDISNTTNRAKFISASGTPVDAGSDGSTPTGSQPLIYIKGDAATWNSATQNLGSTSDFTMTGSVTDSSNEPVSTPPLVITDASFEKSQSIPGLDVWGVNFKSDGTKMYCNSTSEVRQYTLGTAWDIGSITYGGLYSYNSQDTLGYGIAFKPDGTKMYVLGNQNDKIFQYSLSTAWDVTTASYDSISLDVSAQEPGGTGLYFKSDGTKFYTIGFGDVVKQWSLSTAWDISSGSYDSKSLNVVSQENASNDVALSDDGTKAWVVGTANDTVFEYSGTTAWDISTFSYTSNSFSVAPQTLLPRGLFFKHDFPKKMWIADSSNDDVHQYTIG